MGFFEFTSPPLLAYVTAAQCCSPETSRIESSRDVDATEINPDAKLDARAGHRIMKSGWTASGSREPAAFGL
jgi:hypothetical protein